VKGIVRTSVPCGDDHSTPSDTGPGLVIVSVNDPCGVPPEAPLAVVQFWLVVHMSQAVLGGIVYSAPPPGVTLASVYVPAVRVVCPGMVTPKVRGVSVPFVIVKPMPPVFVSTAALTLQDPDAVVAPVIVYVHVDEAPLSSPVTGVMPPPSRPLTGVPAQKAATWFVHASSCGVFVSEAVQLALP